MGGRQRHSSGFRHKRNPESRRERSAKPGGHTTKQGLRAAAWTYTAGADESEQVSTVFSINPNATTVQVVVAYTDCLEGTPAEAKKNAQGDPNKSTLGKGDLPLIVGSWTGTLDPATNKWTFTVNTVQISQIQMAMGARYQKRKPTLGELDTWTGWATTAVAQTGCNLKIRNRGGSNTGFDIYK